MRISKKMMTHIDVLKYVLSDSTYYSNFLNKLLHADIVNFYKCTAEGYKTHLGNSDYTEGLKALLWGEKSLGILMTGYQDDIERGLSSYVEILGGYDSIKNYGDKIPSTPPACFIEHLKRCMFGGRDRDKIEEAYNEVLQMKDRYRIQLKSLFVRDINKLKDDREDIFGVRKYPEIMKDSEVYN
jgi:hypothetical protein